MTEEIASIPGWADERLDEVFAELPHTPRVNAARDAYLACLASRKSPAAPSDILGTEFNGCRTMFRQSLEAERIEGLDALDAELEKFEAELTTTS